MREFSLELDTLNINYIPERIHFIKKFFTDPLKKHTLGENLNEPTQQKQFISKKNSGSKIPSYIAGNVKINTLALTLLTQVSCRKLALFTLKHLESYLFSNKHLYEFKGSLENF